MGGICVIFNPSAGRRRAGPRMEAFRKRWRDRADFWPTEFAGHAEALARRAVEEGYLTIAAAGGDGTVHEVVNGLLSVDARDVRFAVVPIGSANDYAFSIENEFGVSELDDDTATRVDVGVLRTPDGRERYFVEGLGVGLTAEITQQSRLITNRQGLWLYGTAAFRVLWRRDPPRPLRLTWDDEPPVETMTRLLSVLLGQREGNVLMAKHALLDDGQFDVVHVGTVSHFEALRMLPRFLLSGPPADDPRITLRRCRRLRIESRESLTIHTDGEMFAMQDDDVHEVELNVLPLRIRVTVCRL
jgi:diacylglycerol kinase (ATP)